MGFHDNRSPFTEKVATMKEYHCDGGSGGAKWRETIKLYLISKAPEIELVLRSVELHEDVQATTADLRSRSIGLADERVKSLAHNLWSFLTLNLTGDARIFLNNATPGEGFDLWRRLMKGVRSRSEILRHELRNKIHRPTPAWYLWG